MRNPIGVLKSLESHAKEDNYKFKRLYRNLYNPEFYALAYQNIYSKEGNMTKGVDANTIDGMSEKRVQVIIESLKNHSYKPTPSRRIYIPKSNGKQRPLGIQSFNDKLIQEVIRMIMEAIFEPNMSDLSHGFRPKRSCHTALVQVKQQFKGSTWFIEGDIESFFDNIDHHILIKIIKGKIEDEYFISLLWKFLKAGYMDREKLVKTYSGTPQGSIISPILSNIYLNKLDEYMEEFIEGFNKGKNRRLNKEYSSLKDKIRWLEKQKYSKEEWEALSKEERKEIKGKIQGWKKELLKIDSVDKMDSSVRRLSYVRYADDFLCGVMGTKEEAREIKEQIKNFLNDKLKLKLSDQKTLITHGYDKARFLGYDIFVSNSNDQIKNKAGNPGRYFKGRIKLFIPKDKWTGKLIELKALKIEYINGKEVYEPTHRNYMINNDDLEILNQFNSEIRGFKNFYELADNISVLNNFYYVMSYSMFKTYASKYRTRISNIRTKFGYEKFAVKYINKSGKECKAYFYNEGFRRNENIIKEYNVDFAPKTIENANRTSLMDRISKKTCEYCGAEDMKIEMHHVRKLKDLKGKCKWERFMIERRRKTIALCTTCHDKLHAGKLD